MNTESNTEYSASTPSESYLVTFLFCALLTVAFYAIDHSWDASVYVTFTADYTGDENRTGDQLSSLNALSSVFRIFLAGVGLLGLVFARRFKMHFQSPLFWAWFCYWSWLFGSILWSANRPHTAFKLVVLTMFGLAAIGLTRCFKFSRWILVLVLTCSILIAIGGVAELQLGNFTPWKSEYRFVGTKHPNSLAAYGVVVCLAAATYIGRSVRSTVFCLVFGLFGFGCLLLTKSRTSLLSMLVGVAAVQFVRIPSSKRLAYTAAMIGLATVGGLGIALISSAAAKSAIGNAATMGRSEDVSTLTGRLPLWEELLDHIVERPLMGYGYLGFWDADRVERLGDALKWEIPHGHNMYLDLLLDGGIVGLCLYVGFLFAALYAAFRTYNRGVLGGAFVFGLICTVLVHGAGESLFKLPSLCGFILYSSIFRLLWVEAKSAEPEDEEATTGEQELSMAGA